MTGSLARPPRSGGLRGRKMPTIVWVMVGAGVWLAAVGTACGLLAVTKHADAAADARQDARGIRYRGVPENGATVLVEPPVGAIAAGVRESRIAARVSASAGGLDPRRLRCPPRS